jgi:tRNA/tmRNA/rRNA uracil-C5-methylase (TrmA/RlmC/RlmD family)
VTRRRSTSRPRPDGPLAHRDIPLTVGPAAHGGHCIGRYDGRVVFVRHALPGEEVIARVTEDHGGSFCRADAVQILAPSPDRVAAPCPAAGPARCGGCDWQHATPDAQRRLKADVISDALRRIGGVADVEVAVEPLPGGPLGWRTRAQFAVDGAGRLGLHRHRSHDVFPVAHCPLVTPAVDATVQAQPWPPQALVDVAVSGAGEAAVDVRRTRRRTGVPATGPVLHERAADRVWQVSPGSFWQVHPAAADTLTGVVLDVLRPHDGDAVLDLYSGVGLFAGALAVAVGPQGRVVALESDPVAAADAVANLADLAQVTVRQEPVTAAALSGVGADLVVLDPPRTGAGPPVVEAILATGPRAVAYVACDPAALARDLRAAITGGYRLAALRAFDLFPETHHVECVALLTPAASEAPAHDDADRPTGR